jgi:hypothetical protein
MRDLHAAKGRAAMEYRQDGGTISPKNGGAVRGAMAAWPLSSSCATGF